MQFTVLLVFHCALLVAIAHSTPTPQVRTACTAEQHTEMPCLCCKKDCWYTIASAATHELGHMPGEAGEREALATLRLIRTCMITDCADICFVGVPF
ncbi:hypothetical protein RB195_012763 [Necator americanus]|uniref:Uncharacterized protein n=2 Tax=Necator americanus TaxID=51031 RepID=A0ABR1DSG1_NECAM|nr:hypothetical protein NECAME_06425 [Necator americanus]ETN85337.1 hypothetical protein NECAME_06425 [Necator americanus]